MQSLTRESFASKMPDMPTDERKPETLAFRVTRRVYELTKEIAQSERRKPSEVQVAIYERGLAAYQRDGLLFEPVKPQTPEHGKKISPRQTKTG